MAEEKISVIVEAGNAEPGPAMGTKLGPMGVNIGQIIGKINQKTKQFEGMEIPVDIIVDTETKEFEIKVGTPSTSQMLLQKTGIEEGRKTEEDSEQWIGEISFEDIVEIAKQKKADSFSIKLKNVTKEVIGTCKSMGIKIEDKKPTEVIEDINKGEYDKFF